MAHEQAGLKTIAAGFLGFVNGFLSSCFGESRVSKAAHYGLCRTLAICGAVWMRGEAHQGMVLSRSMGVLCGGKPQPDEHHPLGL